MFDKNPCSLAKLSINVSADIVGGLFTGPYNLPRLFSGANYLIILQQVLPLLLDDTKVSTSMRSTIWFQYNGTPLQQ